MTVKLTLSVSADVVEKAKHAARRRKTSVSKLVETYLQKISDTPSGSITKDIISSAPKNKTKPATEKSILKQKLKKKYGH
jgi:Family of unknown function (DUF6364)